MRTRVQTYHRGSRSGRALARAAGLLRLRHNGSRYRARPGDVIVNWGSSELLHPRATYLNHPDNVRRAANKLESLHIMHMAGVPVPPFTTDPDVAQGWLDEDHTVVARTLLRANSGRGIVLVEPGDALPRAPLYTRYVKKFDEYRVHVWRGQVIDIQQKRRRHGHDNIDSRVRNSRGGYVFCRAGLECPGVVADAGTKAVEALSLDFGAADVGFTRRGSVATVYEVNTAPGLEGTTLEHYVGAISAAVRG